MRNTILNSTHAQKDLTNIHKEGRRQRITLLVSMKFVQNVVNDSVTLKKHVSQRLLLLLINCRYVSKRSCHQMLTKTEWCGDTKDRSMSEVVVGNFKAG